MKAEPRTGDKVSWKSHGGTAHGKVVRKVTGTTQVEGHEVRASKDEPQFVVETEDGKRAAHKADVLRKG